MSQVTYNSEKHEHKKVKLQNDSGSEITVRGGHLVVYNADFGTAADSDENRAVRVEINATGNSEHFAGSIEQRYDGKVIADGGVLQMEIAVPTSRGQLAEIWTDQNCTLGVTVLTLRSASFVAGGIEDGVPVAVAMQTVDRSSTAGTVLARLQWPLQPVAAGGSVSARSRAVTALPTAALLEAVSISEIKDNPFFGSLLYTDFTHADGVPSERYVSATYAASAEGKSITEALTIGVGTNGSGELISFTTTDNQAVECQWATPIIVSGGNPWIWGVRIKQSLLTDSLANYFVGLAVERKLDGVSITDAGALVDGGAIGFQLKEADGNAVDFVYDESGQTQNEHDDNYFIPVANTYDTLEMYFNGTTIQGYLNGVSSGTAISAVDIAAADFPTAALMVPVFWHKSANAADFTVTLDWAYTAQHLA